MKAPAESSEKSPAESPHEARPTITANHPEDHARDPRIASSAALQALAQLIGSHAGFRPPDYPNFDELFRERWRKLPYDFTYTESRYQDGFYTGAFSTDPHPKTLHSLELELKIIDQHDDLHDGQREMRRFSIQLFKWLSPQNNPKPQDLTRFTSRFEKSEVFRSIMPLPSEVLAQILPHLDEAEHGVVTQFNARAYCRNGLTDLSFVGMFGFKLQRAQP